MFRRIDHVELVPRDLETTLRFYTDILGFRVKGRHPVGMGPLREVAYLELGDTVLELMGMENPVHPPADALRTGYRAIALEVTDMDAAVAYLTGRGVAITWGPMALGPSKRAEIQDPDGFVIELRQW